MPRSTNKAIARARMQYLGEPRAAALHAVPRDGSLGLDTCSPEQRRLRALMTLGLFNRPGSWQPHRGIAAWGLHTLVAYDIIASPRFNRLVVIADVPHNVAPYLLPSRDGGSSLPGLRLEEFRGRRTCVTRHLPTGAQLVITGNSSGAWDGNLRPFPRWDFYPVNRLHTRPERAQLEEVPDMSEDTERLLAGLMCCIAARGAEGRWAIGNWFSDLPMRPGWLRDEGEDRYEKQLQGSGRQWTFRWNGFPHVDDVAASLTASPIGSSGAVARDTGDHFEVRLDDATLRLNGQRVPMQQQSEVTP
ncbi:hypothetical protein [Streptomyces pinistramenti]|uniref:hypothetical protein n=1 Tax=Streptomyces pinistramenti TaxID=2884812 RepID=UPI001D05D5DA|nr:hypothetical protein [Streptomyces pinistramenti]MCB5909654.1 hypothetical protein [Streptomyces pinistramenti]